MCGPCASAAALTVRHLWRALSRDTCHHLPSQGQEGRGKIFGCRMYLRQNGSMGPCPHQYKQKLLWFMAFLLPLTRADVDTQEDKLFTWKSGAWGQCIGECGPGGLQSRSVWCVHSETWVTHISNCESQDEPASQRNCFKICDWHRDLFQWEVTEWDTCVLVPYSNNEVKTRSTECVTAQRGLQQRQVNCVHKANRSITLVEICEHFTPQPPTEQACLVPCPLDCIVSEFSPWSTCSKNCGNHLQYITRSVISAPLYGGSDCPNLTEWRTCPFHSLCSFGEEEYTYSLKVGPWSECRLPHVKEINLSGRTMLDFGSDSGERSIFRQTGPKSLEDSGMRDLEIGYQTRQVQCMQSDGKNALLSICTQNSMPLHYQSCIMPRDCEVSEWSAWSLCSKTCQPGGSILGLRSRRRDVKHIAVGEGKPCPVLEEMEACNTGGREPLCLSFSWKTSEWTECQASLLTEQGTTSRAEETTQCGGGVQTRKVFCAQSVMESGTKKEVYRPVGPEFCVGPAPSESQLCNIPCPTDCLLSSWTDWGPCIHENCLDPHGRKGYKFRRRQITLESMTTSGNCPHLEEAVPCDDPLCYKWAVFGDLHCVPENGECGHGKYHINTTCLGELGQSVSAELCVDEPPVQLVCKVPCSLDCVISEWSAWSPCSRSCSTKNAEGKQSRTRSILAYPGEGGKSCPSSQALYEYRLCNDHLCTTFYWQTSPWEPCTTNTQIAQLNFTVSRSKENTCGVGVQTRIVFCMKNSTGQATGKRCPEFSKPETIRTCLLPCKRDCVVTLFSEWTSCLKTCQPGNNSVAKQSRYRIITQEVLNGGQECPGTLYEERECETVPVCLMYRWKPHAWKQCVLVPDYVRQGITGASDSCGHGIQTRDIICVTADDHPTEVTECLRWAGPIPPLAQECNIPCKEDCTFTPWTQFTSCSTDCVSSRIRRRHLTGKSKKRDRCQNAEVYPLVETEACACKEYKSHPHGNWSDCIIRDSRNEIQLRTRTPGNMKSCGEGVRFRAIACYDLSGRIVEPTLCSHSGYIEEKCEIPCPFDCRLSDWSSWTPCSSSCGPGVKMRYKFLKEKPYNGGRPCPKLDLKNQVYEAIPCYNECNQYLWVTEPWSACKLHSEEKTADCGLGIQIRKVRCVNISKNAEDDFVSDTYCNHQETPTSRQNCTLSCPGECVMSSWGQWSQCPKLCDSVSLRSRTRFPLRFPASIKPCPKDSETEPCVLNSNCFHYQYNVTEWSTCQLSEKAICGEGIKTRLLDCTRSDGKSVQMSYCEQLGLKKPEKMSLRCLVECTFDCHISDWSAWSPCPQTSGFAGQERSRHIIMQAEGDGRPCPTLLNQYRSCPVYPHYAWSFGEWSMCKVENGQCGEGLKSRNLTCAVHDITISGTKQQVDPKFCGQLPSEENPLSMNCYVPCPGDCHLTEWSHWSSCEVTCIDGRSFETVGRQTRSRTFIVQSLDNQESCPSPIIETRPCTGGKCFKYTWKMSPWRDNKRTVWCQRSDGINVTGGCSPNSQPAAVRSCDPPCRKPFSYCMQSGICGCHEGYTQIMRSSGVLDYCLKVPGPESKKADVKTFIEKSKPSINSKLPQIFNWSIQLFDQDGRVSLWVYVVCVGSFLILVFLIIISYLVCRKPQGQKSKLPQQKPLTLAYDGDFDM
ncbi:thrombospondin type-1 domain-containing protein 7B isoform X1 [Pseudophryne corroboree]|uniref:thrombospondin type-1 domain-containing protein 7B isoform X1 n=2 Tax=Pseudophryne corroboree TaxID=495146 RepID=UPI0030814685